MQVQPTVTFTSGSAVFFLRDPLDMRTGGKISFRFRTLEPRGLIAIARGSAQSVLFFAIEVFDGILYFVFDLGSVSGRKTFADRRVDDGEWNEVWLFLLTINSQYIKYSFTIYYKLVQLKHIIHIELNAIKTIEAK